MKPNDIKKYIEERPWGSFERFTNNELSTVKILTIKANEELSLQYHHNRDEFWRVIQGAPIVTVGDKIIHAKVGNEFFIPREMKHRISGGEEGGKILEIAFGNFDENDIVRTEDRYNRT